MWPDAIPIAIPDVDFFIVPRREFAPTKLFRKVDDRTVVPAAWVKAIFAKYSRKVGEAQFLDYVDPPREVADFVRSLRMTRFTMERIEAANVIDTELFVDAGA